MIECVKYAALGRRVGEMSELLGEDGLEEDDKPKKMLPQYQALQQETSEFEIKATTEDKKKKGEARPSPYFRTLKRQDKETSEEEKQRFVFLTLLFN